MATRFIERTKVTRRVKAHCRKVLRKRLPELAEILPPEKRAKWRKKLAAEAESIIVDIVNKWNAEIETTRKVNRNAKSS